MRYLLAILAMLSVTAQAQTVIVTTNNYNDLNPSRDALAGIAGTFRITHTITDGVEPIDLTEMEPMRLLIIDTLDGSTNNASPFNFVTNSPGTVRWLTPNLNAREYRLQAYLTLPDETRLVFDRYLTVTNPVAVGGTINVSNTVIAGNIESGAVQVAVTVTQETTLVSMSLVPLIASNGAIGTMMYPWGEINARTGTFEVLSISNLNVGGALNAIDDFARTSSVKLVGSVMQGGLTNEYGFFGDGSGLTNLTIAVTQTGQVDSISVTGPVRGAISFVAGTGIALTQTDTVFNVASTVSGSSGTLAYFSDTNGTTQAGSFLYSTINPYDANAKGFFIGTNAAVSTSLPDGTFAGGNARSPKSVDFQVDRLNAAGVAGGTERNTLIGTYRGTISAGSGNGILGGGQPSTLLISSSGSGNWIIGGADGNKMISSSGSGNMIIGGPTSGDDAIIGSVGASAILGSVGFVTIGGNAAGHVHLGGYNNVIITTNMQAGVQIGGRNSSIRGSQSITGQGSVQLAHLSSTNIGEGTFSVGAYIDNTNRSTFMFSDTADATRFRSTSTNQFLVRARGGVGIGTNQPVANGLSVAGPVRIEGVEVRGSGTNLYLVGAGFTNLILTTPSSL